MKKIIKEEKEYRVIEGNDIKKISLSTNKDIIKAINYYSVDISFGEYGILVGTYTNESKAEEVLAEIKTFIDDPDTEEYIVPIE